MTHEEFIQKQKEAQEHFAKMTPEQQEALRATQRRFARKCQDQTDTNFVLRVREKLETNPENVSEQEYQEFLKILERDKKRERRKEE